MFMLVKQQQTWKTILGQDFIMKNIKQGIQKHLL